MSITDVMGVPSLWLLVLSHCFLSMGVSRVTAAQGGVLRFQPVFSGWVGTCGRVLLRTCNVARGTFYHAFLSQLRMSSCSSNFYWSFYFKFSHSLTLTVFGRKNPGSCLLPSACISYRLRTIMKEIATMSPKERVFSECILSCEADTILHLKSKKQGSKRKC